MLKLLDQEDNRSWELSLNVMFTVKSFYEHIESSQLRSIPWKDIWFNWSLQRCNSSFGLGKILIMDNLIKKGFTSRMSAFFVIKVGVSQLAFVASLSLCLSGVVSGDQGFGDV